MEKEVFSDSEVYNLFNKKIVCAKIHIISIAAIEKTSEFENRNKTQLDFLDFHNIELQTPQFLIFDTQGNIVAKQAKFMNSKEFIQFGSDFFKQKHVNKQLNL